MGSHIVYVGSDIYTKYLKRKSQYSEENDNNRLF